MRRAAAPGRQRGPGPGLGLAADYSFITGLQSRHPVAEVRGDGRRSLTDDRGAPLRWLALLLVLLVMAFATVLFFVRG